MKLHRRNSCRTGVQFFVGKLSAPALQVFFRQLVRIQNELNSIGMSMRDMLDVNPLDSSQHYPLTAWQPQFQRMRDDLIDAFHREQQFAPTGRTADQQQYLQSSLAQFWDAMNH